jgi:molybdate transport system substrate-binding protein
LEKVKPLEAWKERLVLGDNVAQAFQFAAEGHANAAIVGKALVLGSSAGNAGRWKEIPRDYCPALIQAGVILGRCADRDAALAWRDFLLGEQGQTILQRYGFASPPPATSAKP